MQSVDVILSVKRKLAKYKSFISLKEIFPEYIKLLNVFYDIKKKNTQTYTCECCCYHSRCTDTCCPSKLTGLSSNELFNKVHSPEITVNDLLNGKYPFAYIILLNKFKREEFLYRTDELRNSYLESFLTFCSNPFLHFDNYRNILYQLYFNIYQDTNIINQMQYFIYPYLYRNVIVNELAKLGVYEGSTTDCGRCELIGSSLCNLCSTYASRKLTPYYDKNVHYSMIKAKKPDMLYWNYKSTTDTLPSTLYVQIKPDTGTEIEINSTLVRVHQIARYALYLSKVKTNNSMSLFNIKSLNLT